MFLWGYTLHRDFLLFLAGIPLQFLLVNLLYLLNGIQIHLGLLMSDHNLLRYAVFLLVLPAFGFVVGIEHPYDASDIVLWLHYIMKVSCVVAGQYTYSK